MKVLALDCGFHLGSGLVQFDGPVKAGTYRVPGSVRQLGEAMTAVEGHLTRMFTDYMPDLVAVAEPFIRQRPFVPTADSLRPLFAFEAKVEEMAYKFKRPIVEVNEMEARGYFMHPVPRSSKEIKAAALQFCRDRRWACPDDHSADALLIAAYVLALKNPDRQHELLPLYQRRRAA